MTSTDQPSFCDAVRAVDGLTRTTCPVCGRTSYNSNDIREGYCGNCHDWTGVPR